MPDISMCGSTECPSRDTCYRATATPSEHQSWRDFEATRNGRERCDSYVERTFLGLTDMSTDELYAEIFDDHESEVAMQIIEQAKEPLTEEIVNTELASLKFALAERNRLDPDAPKAIVFPESPDNSQLRNTQIALRNLYKAVQKSRSVNDPLGMATAMEEAGKWF